MVEKDDQQGQRRDPLPEEIERTKEKRSIHIQVEHGHTKQRQAQTGFGEMERSSFYK